MVDLTRRTGYVVLYLSIFQYLKLRTRLCVFTCRYHRWGGYVYNVGCTSRLTNLHFSAYLLTDLFPLMIYLVRFY